MSLKYLEDTLTALVISLQDDIVMSQSEAFLEEFSDPFHEDCPHGNYVACPKCRCSVAHDLIANILHCIDEEGYELLKRKQDD